MFCWVIPNLLVFSSSCESLRDDAISTRALRVVELRVRVLDEIHAAAILIRERSDADRNGHANLLVLEDEAALLDLLAKPFGQCSRTFQIRFRQHDAELFAAVTRE